MSRRRARLDRDQAQRFRQDMLAAQGRERRHQANAVAYRRQGDEDSALVHDGLAEQAAGEAERYRALLAQFGVAA